MNILIRVDANSLIGAGHLMRCVALAHGFLSRSHQVYFLVNDDTECHIKQNDFFTFEYIKLNITDEVLQISELSTLHSIDLIILDGYQFNKSYKYSLKTVCNGADILLIILDDCNDNGEIQADVLVNPVTQARELGYEVNAKGAKLLLGDDYTLLRPEFLKGRQKPYRDSDALVLCFGASDIKGLSLPLCKFLLEHTTIPNIVIVSGVAYETPNELNKLASTSNQRLSHFHNVSDMSEIMETAKLFVSAAGGTSFELAALAVPSLFVVVADNQLNAAKSHMDKCWSTFFDARAFCVEKNITEQHDILNALMQSILDAWQDDSQLEAWHQVASSLPKKDGARNVVLACEELSRSRLKSTIKSQNITLREVQERDLELIRAWRNDQDVSKFMIDQKFISEEKQTQWFANVKSSLSQQHFIIEFRGEAIGVANIKSCHSRPLYRSKEVEPGLYIYDRRYRGNFLAFCPSIVLNDYCFKNLNVDTLVATVLADNKAALKFNKALGYKMEDAVTIDFESRSIQAIKMRLDSASYGMASEKIRRFIR